MSQVDLCNQSYIRRLSKWSRRDLVSAQTYLKAELIEVTND